MSQLIEVKVPDIGDFKDVPVIEILVKPGDTVKAEDALITLESDKATMDVPSPAAGTVKEVKVSIGDKVTEGATILVLDSEAGTAATAKPEAGTSKAEPPVAPSAETPADGGTDVTEEPIRPVLATPPASPAAIASAVGGGRKAHASPSIRRFARDLGVDVSRLTGTGPKGRILKEDVEAYIKGVLSQPVAQTAPAVGGLDLLPWPEVDFAKFGPVETKPLSRIKKISGANLHRNWVMIPHVTQFDEADVTDLEAFRSEINREAGKDGTKLTMLAFLIKASVAALRRFPEFNASLETKGGEMSLVLKQYFHIGFAADTPFGLVVPVIRDADRKSVTEIAAESAALAKKGREGKLAPGEMQGGCFTISSLGGIGGTAFTPIINAPEVAILGVSKSQTKPVWNGEAFVPRLMLPLSLSYDHRVVDGASGARFTAYLVRLLADMRRTLL
jgi:pyruvate dehydrogenase E2 component (dihydrolipoamide acetyltransferase)